MWKNWEDKIQKEEYDPKDGNFRLVHVSWSWSRCHFTVFDILSRWPCAVAVLKAKVTNVQDITFIKNRFLGFGKDSAILGWLVSFLFVPLALKNISTRWSSLCCLSGIAVRVFQAILRFGNGGRLHHSSSRFHNGIQIFLTFSVFRYLWLQFLSCLFNFGFGMFQTHCKSNPKFNFHKYMVRALEADFKKVVGIRWEMHCVYGSLLLSDLQQTGHSIIFSTPFFGLHGFAYY